VFTLHKELYVNNINLKIKIHTLHFLDLKKGYDSVPIYNELKARRGNASEGENYNFFQIVNSNNNP